MPTAFKGKVIIFFKYFINLSKLDKTAHYFQFLINKFDFSKSFTIATEISSNVAFSIPGLAMKI